ncbi:hypothetical protein [Salinispora arenicola]|uniref:Uncharacterized protein n=2 Tax=Salinispora arenicola TaxID=168697 RepID=A0A542XSL0_SALAC|nr:hypothetical protein [Salinispora arenicola]MCN0152949.1 hypothetical protein [Salinispora arenicola]MCN0178947.1 hypothetical protein [Salinispora arenicola]NIL41182.1 hypothetical protein [Salinispora arenicola]TQL38814.1 hypothetical protein FB564_4027 [Salinispora arenicola]GIM85738.1 hypothetical protein Sar04_24740 [Salinispora arenicola]
MTDQHGELDSALERVVEAARHHLAAVRAAQGRIDDDDVWQAYVALNNASYAYDEQLMDAFGEVTPWDVQAIDPDEADQRLAGPDGAPGTDAYPRVISVRQRRDYRVPSVSALIRAAGSARRAETPDEDEPAPVEGVGEAVLELLQSGDGSLAALDVPELEPLDGVVMVSEVGAAVDLESFDDDDPVGPFQPAADDRLVGRLDEHPFLELDDEEHDHVH